MKEEFNSVLGEKIYWSSTKKEKKEKKKETRGILRGTNYFLFFINSI